ncbi:MAG: flagellar motor stator protein MotA [Fimbriimonadaceae bacterium]|nr:flagellar motor stator protein MotA [Fimbriimonadaceae bacterium]
MFAFIGIIVAIISTLLGYTMHGGSIAILIQPTEFIILGGVAIGIFLGSSGLQVTMQTIQGVLGLLKPDLTKQAYVDLLKMMYQLFSVARKEGLLGLEKHIENPEESDIISKFPSFMANHHAVHFFCDTLKVILTGAVGPHDLSEMMELDLETAEHEEMKPSHAVQNLADAMPAVGIVAAVLGIVITMGKIGGDPKTIGMSVGVALVGTFFGIFSGYVIFNPIAKALETKVHIGHSYMNCIRHALFSFARGESPITCVEFARRNIVPTLRPGFAELEAAVKEKDAA